jgi:hypothetical protein
VVSVRQVVGGRGVAEPVSYAENTFSVFVLAEHGAFGGMLVLGLYLLLTIAVGSTAMAGSTEAPAAYRASRALFLVATLIIAIPAAYVALSNLGACTDHWTEHAVPRTERVERRRDLRRCCWNSHYGRDSPRSRVGAMTKAGCVNSACARASEPARVRAVDARRSSRLASRCTRRLLSH